MSEALLGGRVTLHVGDCLDVLRTLPDSSVDSVVTDPPYHLTSIVKRFGGANAAPAKVKQTGAFARASKGFMGQVWDGGDIAFQPALWAEVLRVLKPGGHCAAFSGTRTYHRMACAIEDAGFEIRDQLAWTYGTGFPKSHDVSKGIDKAAGAERKVVRFDARKAMQQTPKVGTGTFGDYEWRPGEITASATPETGQWQGWGTALKPAWEPICLARKPLIGTVAETVLAHGTGALNINGCKIAYEGGEDLATTSAKNPGRPEAGERSVGGDGGRQQVVDPLGRWPANILHDGDVGFGAAGRYFYCAKADAFDRAGSLHPTVKPVSLMAWLVRLITPPGGTVLDLFAGTGTTGAAAYRESASAVLIEREPAYAADIRRRMALELAGPEARRIAGAAAKAEARKTVPDHGPLFLGAAE